MEVGAAVACLDALAQRGNVLHRAGLVVDGHTGGQHGVLVDFRKEFLGVDAAVRAGQHFNHGEAFFL